jgi:hypothetical protein
MSDPAAQLTQDLRLFDLLQAHPELNEPTGVQLRDRLATLCEHQGDPASPVRIAETVADYLKETPGVVAPMGAIPWKRPATKEEWEEAQATIRLGHEAAEKLKKVQMRGLWMTTLGGAVLGALVGGILHGPILLTAFVGVILWPVLYAVFMMEQVGPEHREKIKAGNAEVQKWAIEQTEGREVLQPRPWTHGVPGWELREGVINPIGMRKYQKSPNAMKVLRVIHQSGVPLLAADFAHLDRLANEDQAAREKSEDETTRQEWAAALAQSAAGAHGKGCS